MNVGIFDCTKVWLKEGARLLTEAGHEVKTLFMERAFADSLEKDRLTSEELDILEWADAIIVGKDLTKKATCWRFLVMARADSDLPIIVWTGGYLRNDEWLVRLQVSAISKPTRTSEPSTFAADFLQLVENQKLIFGGQAGLYLAAVDTDCGTKEDPYGAKTRKIRLHQLREIVTIDGKGFAFAYDEDGGQSRHSWGWGTGQRDWGVTKHEVGHALCDGNLSSSEIAEFLPELRRVLQLAYKAMPGDLEEDGRFKPCADLVLDENTDPEEFQLVRY